MEGLSTAYILQFGIVFSVGFALIALGALYLNPRIMLASYPKEVQARLPPLTPSEKRQQTVLGIFVWGYALVGLFYANAQFAARSGQAAFLPLFLNTYLVFEIVNLFDLLVIDYLVLLVLKPPSLFIPGTLALGQDHGFGFHFKGFLKGSVLGVVISAVIALISLVILNMVAA
jgi:hypothetical protein